MPGIQFSPVVLRSPEDVDKPVVLCVDDDLAVLSALRRLLRDEPYRVVTTPTPAGAFAVLRRQPISVIISDERMPVTTGMELLSEVRDRWPSIGRIILTAFAGRDTVVRGLEAGVDLLLTKPWDGESLKRTVRRLIGEVDRARAQDGEVDLEDLDLGGEGG